MIDLWAPRRDEDLWLARGDEEVNPNRPILTGDVFKLGEIPGVSNEESCGSELGMIVSHPCAMREGPQLRSRIEVVRVLIGKPVEPTGWGQYKTRLPLPGLETDDDETEYYAALDLSGRIESSVIDLFARLACLSEAGIAALLQRRTWRQTQYVAEHEAFLVSNEHVFLEAELHENWCDYLVGDLPRDDELDRIESRQILEREALAFDEVLSRSRPLEGKKKKSHSCREDLVTISARSTAKQLVKRDMAAERKRRQEEESVTVPPTAPPAVVEAIAPAEGDANSSLLVDEVEKALKAGEGDSFVGAGDPTSGQDSRVGNRASIAEPDGRSV